jgi:Ribbon-helix-helix protein, copG family
MLDLSASRRPSAIMDPRLFEDLLRGDAYLPPRVTAVVAETVKFAVKELAEIDDWARRNEIKSRSEAIRRLVERGLKRS